MVMFERKSHMLAFSFLVRQDHQSSEINKHDSPDFAHSRLQT